MTQDEQEDGVVVVGPDGQEYEFPVGTNPQQAAATIKAKLGSVSSTPPPFTGSGVMDRKSFASNPIDDHPDRQPGFKEQLTGRLRSAAEPQGAGDLADLVIPEVSGAGGMLRTLGQGMKGLMPNQGTAGKMLETIGRYTPRPLNPLQPLKAAGQDLQARHAARTTRHAEMEAAREASAGVDALNARQAAQPPTPPPEALGRTKFSGSTGSGADAPLVPSNPSMKQGSAGPAKREAVLNQMQPKVQLATQPLPNIEELKKALRASGASESRVAAEVQEMLINYLRLKDK